MWRMTWRAPVHYEMNDVASTEHDVVDDVTSTDTPCIWTHPVPKPKTLTLNSNPKPLDDGGPRREVRAPVTGARHGESEAVGAVAVIHHVVQAQVEFESKI